MSNPDIDGLHVVFYTKAVKNNSESEIRGYPVFHEQERLRILIAGDKFTEVDRKASEEDRQRFSRAYENFQKKREQVAVGFPIENWPQLDVAQVARLKEYNIFTVELLSALSDANARNMGPGMIELREKAKHFLNNSAPAAAQAERMGSLEAENAALKERLAALERAVVENAAAPRVAKKPKKDLENVAH